MAKQATELRYAVRFRVVFKYFGQLCLVLATLSLAPLAISLIFGDTRIRLRMRPLRSDCNCIGESLCANVQGYLFNWEGNGERN